MLLQKEDTFYISRPDNIHGLWNYVILWAHEDLIVVSASLQACVMLTFTSGIHFFLTFYWHEAQLLEHTTSSYHKSRLIQSDVFSFRASVYWYKQPGMRWITLKFIIFFFYPYLFIQVSSSCSVFCTTCREIHKKVHFCGCFVFFLFHPVKRNK